ncbi:MAG: hypothetical protein ACYDEF_05320 [Methanosarcina sp.]
MMDLLPYMMLDTWKPEIFHGRRKRRIFFEGWYFKMVDRSEKNAYAVIPGVSISWDPLKCHAFVMFLDSRTQRMHYFRYPIDDLKASDKKFDITIGGSSFSIDEMRLNLEQGRDRIVARISFKDMYP